MLRRSAASPSLLPLRWRNRLACVLLLMAFASSADSFGQSPDDSPPPASPSTGTAGSVEDRLEILSESHRQLMEQFNRVLKENESLTERLDALQTSMPAEGSAPLTVGDSPADDASVAAEVAQPLMDDAFQDNQEYGLKSLFDSFNSRRGKKSKPWYERMTIRGYSQIRFDRFLTVNPPGSFPTLLGDRSITNDTGTFSIRRARLILAEDVNDHLFFYFQTDFANNPADGTNTLFGQVRDLYADIYIDTTKINRVRIGQSKIPWGWEEMQSSSNRVPLDRSDAIDSGDNPNQRDLGIFYYWTPEDKQELLRDLVEGGLKGSGNYGIFALGVYNGQGGSEVDLNRSVHTVARFTWPFRLANGQTVEMSIQGYSGKFVVAGAPISPNGGAVAIPTGTGYPGLQEQRLAGTFVYYPQPFGLQAEWNVGRGPGLNNDQTAVQVRNLEGGYIMGLYKLDTPRHGILFPFARYQHYRGGYRSIPNAPYGTHDEVSVGVEWQICKALEIVTEYGNVINGIGLDPLDQAGTASYQNFQGQMLRFQVQINY